VRPAALLLLATLVLGAGCMMPRYLGQAAHGQLDLMARARPIDAVIADPREPHNTRVLLAELDGIKRFGASHGLRIRRNYRHYVEARGVAAVWFVGAADPLSFTARSWCFPIAGCFTGVGWFDLDEALTHRDRLRRDGYDAFARPAAAYSTGGWFPDPVVSPMLGDGHGAFADLANVILHESVHASVLVPDQPFFNESFAEYVADRLTDRWVVERFGAGSDEEVAWLFGQAVRRARTSRMVATYRALDALYQRKGPAAATLAAKAAIIDRVVAELRLVQRPNNASLIEMQVYQAGGEVHAQAHAACGDLRTLVRAAATLRRGDFARRLEQDLAPIGAELTRRCQQLRTATAATAPPTQKNEQL
jgi:predicted aminopeptidase